MFDCLTSYSLSYDYYSNLHKYLFIKCLLSAAIAIPILEKYDF